MNNKEIDDFMNKITIEAIEKIKKKHPVCNSNLLGSKLDMKFEYDEKTKSFVANSFTEDKIITIHEYEIKFTKINKVFGRDHE